MSLNDAEMGVGHAKMKCTRAMEAIKDNQVNQALNEIGVAMASLGEARRQLLDISQSTNKVELKEDKPDEGSDTGGSSEGSGGEDSGN